MTTPFDFMCRWSPGDAEGFRRFFCDLVALMQAERAAERRRLTTDAELFEDAVAETRREIDTYNQQGGSR